MLPALGTEKQHLQDLGVGLGAGHQREVELVLVVRDVIAVHSLSTGLFGC